MMSERLEVRIITPERVVYSHEVDSILLPGAAGEMEILPGHVALFSTIRPGRVRIRDGAGEKIFACGEGFVEVNSRAVTLLVDSAAGNLEIDPAAAQALIDEAEDKLRNLENTDEETRYAFETQLASARARIEVYEQAGGGKNLDEGRPRFSIQGHEAVEGASGSGSEK